MSLQSWVVVFDLDDTLISEIEYQRSGIRAVEEFIESVYGIPFQDRIQSARDQGIDDLWGWACEQANLPSAVATSFLWVYRLHRPSIFLVDGIKDVIKALVISGAKLAILSDGRSTSQRLKLLSVNLAGLPLYISEDYCSVKPDAERFIAIENQWPLCRYAYIADNLTKDFVVPNTRGWLTIGADWVNPRVHQRKSECILDLDFHPMCWLSSPSEILNIISSS